jgi:hypothetical protein
VPEDWDLTGFSGTDASGYLRVDDSEEQAVEVKWATEPPRTKKEPSVTDRRAKFIIALRQTAKKKKIAFDATDVDVYRPVVRPERTVAPFTWVGDRKAFGAVWYCRTCRRVVIAQVLGAPSGRGGLAGAAEAVLSSLRCHGEDPAWKTWALYDLHTEVPSEYMLDGQQLMNVYLRLSFLAHKTSRLTVEQWSLANVARKDAYLDVWLGANTKGDLNDAKYEAAEGEMRGHPALELTGRLALGLGVTKAAQQLYRFQIPATRFRGVAWECEPSNKLYLVQQMRPGRAPQVADEVARRTMCHEEGGGAAR